MKGYKSYFLFTILLCGMMVHYQLLVSMQYVPAQLKQWYSSYAPSKSKIHMFLRGSTGVVSLSIIAMGIWGYKVQQREERERQAIEKQARLAILNQVLAEMESQLTDGNTYATRIESWFIKFYDNVQLAKAKTLSKFSLERLNGESILEYAYTAKNETLDSITNWIAVITKNEHFIQKNFLGYQEDLLRRVNSLKKRFQLLKDRLEDINIYTG